MKNSPSENFGEKRGAHQVLELEDIIEDESGEREAEKSKGSMIVPVLPDNERSENFLKISKLNLNEGSNTLTLKSIPMRPRTFSTISNMKHDFSSRTFSLFAMNLPISPPMSSESIIEDDESCCNRIICCPEMIRRRDVSKKFFGKKWCLNYATVFKIFTNVVILVIFWGWLTLQVFVKNYSSRWLGDVAFPGGKLFDLLFITLIGYLVGWGLNSVPYLRLPPIVGMLFFGILVRNVYFNGKPLYDLAIFEDREKLDSRVQPIDEDEINVNLDEFGYTTSGNLRSFCLTFVMMRAGLQIDARKLARHRRAIFRLGIVPGSVECLVVAIAAWNWLEVDVTESVVKPLPFIYCLLAGAIVAVVSPVPAIQLEEQGYSKAITTIIYTATAIVAVMSPVTAIQCAIQLEEQGYSKAITTIIYTATSIDSVYMVSVFSFFYSLALRFWVDDSSTHAVKKSFQSTYALVAGALIGLAFGILLVFFPHRRSPFAFWFRVINLNLACIFCTCWGYSVSNIGAGLMGTCATCFVALTGWKIIDRDFKDARRIRMIVGILWHIAQPFLVVGIGVQIDFASWKLERASWKICVLALGLVSRCLAAIYVARRYDISWKESVFIALAWTPKGHLQVAIGPLAYQTLRGLYKNATSDKQRFKEEIKYAQVLIMFSFMTIAIMGPLGSILTMKMGPRLVSKHVRVPNVK